VPVYCETALNWLGTFPAEPINTITSFVPVATGLLALLYLLRRRERNAVAYTLAGLTIMTGLGSVAWHATRTSLALTVDALPGVAYFIVIAFFWLYAIGNRWIAVAFSAVFAVMVFLVPRVEGVFTVFLISVVVTAIGLVVATWYRNRPAFGFAALAVGAGLIAVTMRTLDSRVCDLIPFGTHFLWHVFLGIAAYAGVRLMLLLRPRASGQGPTRSG